MKSQNNLVDRSVRQHECLVKWVQHKCVGTIIAPTGTGKTRIGVNAIALIHKNYPQFKSLVIVPTDIIQKQWKEDLKERGLSECADVEIVNTVIKNERWCNLLVMDECHRYSSDCFRQIFTHVHYRYILGLTATFERLDGKHVLMQKWCPIVDTIKLEEALINHWISDYTEYQVLIDVPDIADYDEYQQKFQEHFEFFNWDFGLCMSMKGADGWKVQAHYRDILCPNGTEQERKDTLKAIKIHSAQLSHWLSLRKNFINNHPKKLEIARAIINARSDKKIITFANSIEMARKIGIGETYSSRNTKKKNEQIIENFKQLSSGVLNTSKKAIEGVNLPDLSVAIILGLDSSQIKAKQKLGRAVRFVPNKKAEIFNIVINGTQECKWFRDSHKDMSYITIDEENLYKVLKGEPFETYKKPIQNLTFRF